MSSKTYLNMTPERLRAMEELRQRRLEAERALAEAVRKAMKEREERVARLIQEQRDELARQAVERLRETGSAEAAEAHVSAGWEAGAEAVAAHLAGAESGSSGFPAPPAPRNSRFVKAAAARLAEAEAARALAPPRTPEQAEADRERIARTRAFHGMLTGMNPESGSLLEPLLSELLDGMDRSRMDLIYDSVRAALAKEVTVQERTAIFKEELKGFIERRPAGGPGDDMARGFSALMAQPRIHPEDMEAARKEYCEAVEEERRQAVNREILDKAREYLASKGYSMYDARGNPIIGAVPLTKDAAYYFADSNPDFRVRALVDRNGGLNLQQVRVMSAREEPRAAEGPYQRHLELQHSAAWCAAQGALAEHLESQGHRISFKIYKESGAQALPIMVDYQKASFARKAGQDLKLLKVVQPLEAQAPDRDSGEDPVDG
jgi:hypothetical protein